MVDIFGKRRKEPGALAPVPALTGETVAPSSPPAEEAELSSVPSGVAKLRRPAIPVPARKPPVMPTAPMRTDLARRPNNTAIDASRPRATGGRQLVVGRDISLSGEIKECERLVVEGSVAASLIGCAALEVAEGGSFRGPASVNEALIAGQYEGELTVQGRLTVTSSGRVSGRVVYREIEIQGGGQVTGTLDLLVTPI